MTLHIKFKLYASLGDYLPAGSHSHTAEIEIDETATPHQIIERYRVPREQAHLILLNGVYLRPDQRDQPVFKDGDAFAIWPPVAGG
ncbi:MAG: MoaD/ThiS family protein [Gammaproteobacteria bacterium]